MPAQKAKLTLYSPVRCLPGVGPKMELRFSKLGIRTIQDLFFHFPHRFQDKTKITPLHLLLTGEAHLICGAITDIKRQDFGKKPQSLITINDGTESLLIRLFSHPKHTPNFTLGSHLLCFGTVNHFNHTLQMVHPDIEIMQGVKPALSERLTPIYPTTAGLHQKSIRNLVTFIFDEYEAGHFKLDLLPNECAHQFDLPPLKDLLYSLHFPKPQDDQDTLKQLVSVEELTTHHLNILTYRKERTQLKAPSCSFKDNDIETFTQCLPFQPTQAQAATLSDIKHDLSAATPMLRLVQGDVGCGKTVIAAFAIFAALKSGYQVALMAPTEILAQQHFETLSLWFTESQHFNIELLTSKTNAKQRQKITAQLEQQESILVIGTHALYQKDISFTTLGLIVIDEQHRFGVEQRRSLAQKNGSTSGVPHQLILSATPIPRTLAMSLFSCLDISTIQSLPEGRQPTTTVVIPTTKRTQLLARIQAASQNGQQTFWVCPLIEQNESNSEAAAITSLQEIEEMLNNMLPDIRYSKIHGRMSSEEKQLAIDRFRSQESMILLATTVIEVGVNIPNANIMIIEHADRFGLAQLHQLRGRVGRGNEPGYCILLYESPLGQFGQKRLAAIRDCSDGFEIAEQDLALRGPGEVLGTGQTGAIQFKVADIMRDKPLLTRAKHIADWLIQNDQNNTLFKLNQRWLTETSDDHLSA